MGGSISNLWNRFHKHRDFRILMIGLDSAGKTTILYRLKLDETVASIPTIGFNVETVSYKNLHFVMWDIGGQEKFRLLWHHYFENTNAVIFVVDSSDMDRIEQAKAELHRVSNDSGLQDAPFLILGNKNDLPNAVGRSELIDKLDLYMIRGRNWYVQSTNALTGDGIYEGLEWLSNAIISRNN